VNLGYSIFNLSEIKRTEIGILRDLIRPGLRTARGWYILDP
jgi:hypothetical protein